METISEPRAFVRHLRQERICLAGARAWWRQHELNWQRFVEVGIPVSVLRETGDHFALKVVARAEADHGG